jgi:hypothetical protein
MHSVVARAGLRSAARRPLAGVERQGTAMLPLLLPAVLFLTAVVIPDCTTRPQPCGDHSNRTFCQSDPYAHQCSAPRRAPTAPCPPCPSPPLRGPCRSEKDCSLGGDCDTATGECHCDPTWTGPNCVELNLLPANRSSHGYDRGIGNQSMASWGGQAVWEDGLYHLIYADFETCGLGCWGTASQLARAVSQSPTGPFRSVHSVAAPSFAYVFVMHH